MPDPTDTFGERAATSAEVTQWIALVRAQQRAQRGYKPRKGKDNTEPANERAP